MDYSKYFEQKKNTVYFIGDKLEVFIPKRYENHGCLEVSTVVQVLGMFDMTINDEIKVGYALPAMIAIEASEMANVSVGDTKFLKLTLFKGDAFIKDIEVVQNPSLAYVIFYEFINNGSPPAYVNYSNISELFGDVKEVNNISFGVDHVMFEMMYSQLFRDPNNINLLYRLTDMSGQALQIALSAVSHMSTSTTSKLVGSYFANSINAALNTENKVPSKIEELYRN